MYTFIRYCNKYIQNVIHITITTILYLFSSVILLCGQCRESSSALPSSKDPRQLLENEANIQEPGEIL